LSNLRGWNEGKSKWRGQDNPRRGIEEPGGKAAVWQAIARTASYPYHNPNEIDILIPTRSSAICGCEGSQITASYRAAGRRGSRVPNRQVMSLRARPLSYIGENANSCIKSSFGNGWFLLFFSLSTYGQFPFITICIQDYLIHFITTLRVLDWGGVLEYYIFIVQSSFPFVTLLITVTDFLYLVFGLSYIPYGLHSCRSLAFVIFLQGTVVLTRSEQSGFRHWLWRWYPMVACGVMSSVHLWLTTPFNFHITTVRSLSESSRPVNFLEDPSHFVAMLTQNIWYR